MSNNDNELNSNVFRIESGTQLTEGSQSTASFYHPLDTPKTFFMSPSEQNSRQILIKPTKQNIARVKYESVDSHIRELIVNQGRKGNQQLPKLHIPRGERENTNTYYRQYMFNHKRESPETMRSYLKNKSSTRPNSRDLTVLFSHRDRIQQDSYVDSFRGDKIDESNKWENSIRKEGQSVVDNAIKNQGVPLFKVQSLGLQQKQTQRIRLQKQIANIEESSNVKGDSKVRRARTIGNPSSHEPSNAEDTSVENHYVFTERPARVSSSPYILEGIRPSHLEKGAPFGSRNPFSYPLNPNPVKSQGEIEENLRKAGFRSAVAINPGARINDESRLPVELLFAKDKLPLHQNISNTNNPMNANMRDDKHRQPRSSIEIKSAGMPHGNILAKVVSNEPKKLQRALSDVRSYNISPFEEVLSRPETREINSQLAAKLKPKFRGEEAILNKLFNRKK